MGDDVPSQELSLPAEDFLKKTEAAEDLCILQKATLDHISIPDTQDTAEDPIINPDIPSPDPTQIGTGNPPTFK